MPLKLGRVCASLVRGASRKTAPAMRAVARLARMVMPFSYFSGVHARGSLADLWSVGRDFTVRAIREANLHELAVREPEGVRESHRCTRPVGADVDLVG